jgi:CubicO group peptidase (beta-lactamase class C family)
VHNYSSLPWGDTTHRVPPVRVAMTHSEKLPLCYDAAVFLAPPHLKRNRMCRLCAIVACICVSLTCLASTSPASPDKVDQYVEAEMHRQRIPGLALGVYRDGKVIRAQGYGLANVELNVPVTPETIFQSGSVGKQFTATAVMMLVEQGRVSLDDSITKYFPDTPPSWQKIKVRNLLSHTSGLKEYTDDTAKPGGPINWRADYTEEQLLKIIESFPVEYQPGDKWNYCNTNYVLLGMLIHKVTGQFYGDYLQEHIFRPLGMTSTRIISESDIIPNRSAGYRLVRRQWKNQEWVAPSFNTTADGSLYFNILDLAKWDAALFTDQLLKKSSFDQMWTVFPLNDGKANADHYGFAWFIDKVNGHRVIEHGGAWQGFTTYIARYVDDKLTVVVLANLDSAHCSTEKIAHSVAGLYDPRLAVPELKPIEDKEPRVTARLRTLLDSIAAGRAAPDAFSPQAWKDFSPGLSDVQGDLKALGELRRLELLEHTQKEGKRAYQYRGTYTDWTVLFNLSLGPDDKIADFAIRPD